jgi:hypothetical protein
LYWKLAVETADMTAAFTVVDGLVVGNLAAAASCGRDAADAAGAVMLGTLTETCEVVPRLVGEPATEDPRRGVVAEMLELLLLGVGVDFVAWADDDGEVGAGVVAVVDGPEAAVVSALVVEVPALVVAVVGFVRAVPVLEDGDADDEAGPEDVEPADVEPLDELEEPLEEPVDEEPRGSASAIPGPLAIAAPTPNATANAPTRPT